MRRIFFSVISLILCASIIISCDDDDDFTSYSGTISDHGFVDLGLPSGTLWATCNLGTNHPEEFGKYYAWGETKSYSEVDSTNISNIRYNLIRHYRGIASGLDSILFYVSHDSLFFFLSDYVLFKIHNAYNIRLERFINDSICYYISIAEDSIVYKFIPDSIFDQICTKTYYDLTTYKHYDWLSQTINKYKPYSSLKEEDDAALDNWGKSWRVPTKEEIYELRHVCKWTWTKLNGVYGYKVEGLNGNNIFLPSGGYINKESSIVLQNMYGLYWCSNMDLFQSGSVMYGASGLFFMDDSYSEGLRECWYGSTIRPVIN